MTQTITPPTPPLSPLPGTSPEMFSAAEPFRVLSLGGGVQSSTMALMAAQGLLASGAVPHAAVWADTGWDRPTTSAMVEWLGTCCPFPVFRVSQGDLRQHVRGGLTERYISIPSRAGERIDRRICTRHFKTDVISTATRQLMGCQPRQRLPADVVEMWLGMSTDEVIRCKPSKHRWQRNRWPLIEANLTRSDCQRWWAAHAPAGAPALGRSSCIGCPYHSRAEWADLARTYPDMVEEAAQIEDRMQAEDVALSQPVSFLHRRMIPLREAIELDLREAEWVEAQGALFADDDDGWGNECEGMCGV